MSRSTKKRNVKKVSRMRAERKGGIEQQKRGIMKWEKKTRIWRRGGPFRTRATHPEIFIKKKNGRIKKEPA